MSPSPPYHSSSQKSWNKRSNSTHETLINSCDGSSSKRSRIDRVGSKNKSSLVPSTSSPRLASLTERFAFKPSTTSSHSSTVFSRYNSIFSSSLTKMKTSSQDDASKLSVSAKLKQSASSVQLDQREQEVVNKLRKIFERVPLKMIHYSVRQNGTFESAAAWLESQDLDLSSMISLNTTASDLNNVKDNMNNLRNISQNGNSPLSSSSFRTSAKFELSKPTRSIREKFGSSHINASNRVSNESHRYLIDAHESSSENEDDSDIIIPMNGKASTEHMKDLSDSKPVKPRRRLIKASFEKHSPAQVLDDDSDRSVDLDTENDSDFENRVLNFLNTASLEDIADISAVDMSLVKYLVDARPFESLHAARLVIDPSILPQQRKNRQKKILGDKIVDSCSITLRGYEAVDSLIQRCEELGNQVSQDISNWGVDIFGRENVGKSNLPSDSGQSSSSSINLDISIAKANPNENNTNNNITECSNYYYYEDDEDEDDHINISTRTKRRSNVTSRKNHPNCHKIPHKYFSKAPSLLSPEVKLQEYQQVGINWLSLLYERKLSCILADEMGLGKTCQVISFLAHLKEIGNEGPHLVVVPSSTLENWLREFQKFCPSFIVEPYYGSQFERAEIRDSLAHSDSPKFDVMITTYNLACSSSADFSFLKHQKFNVCVYDEGHMLKNSQSERYSKLMRLSANFRLLLTGTPLQNNLKELISLLAFILPKIFVSRKDDLSVIFKHKAKPTTASSPSPSDLPSPSPSLSEECMNPTRSSSVDYSERNPLLSEQRITKAKTMMAPFVLRRKKEQVLQNLPRKNHMVEYCDLTDKQQIIYNQELEASKKAIKEKLSGEKNVKNVGNILMRLRKASLHHLLFRKIYNDSTISAMSKEIMKEPQYVNSIQQYIFEDMSVMTDSELNRLCEDFPTVSHHKLPKEEWFDSGKISKLKELLPKMKTQGDRVLIFSQFTQVLDILERVLDLLQISFLRLDGQTPVDMRQDTIDKYYEESDITVFLLSTKAGGFGINLTCANTVIIYDLSFNPHDDKQAEDRAHRVGQTREVNVIRLVTRNTIEENILELANTKLALDRSVSGDRNDSNIKLLDLPNQTSVYDYNEPEGLGNEKTSENSTELIIAKLLQGSA